MARFRSVEQVSEKSRMTTRRKVSSQTRASPDQASTPPYRFRPLMQGLLASQRHFHMRPRASKPPNLEQPYRASTKQDTTKNPHTYHFPKKHKDPAAPSLPNPQPPSANPRIATTNRNHVPILRTRSVLLPPSPPPLFPTTILTPSSPPLPNPH